MIIDPPVTQESVPQHIINSKVPPLLISVAFTAIAAVASIVSLIKGLGWYELRKSRLFDLIVLQLVLILPLLVAMPVNLLGWDPPQDYSTTGILRTGSLFLILLIVSVILGAMWNKKKCS